MRPTNTWLAPLIWCQIVWSTLRTSGISLRTRLSRFVVQLQDPSLSRISPGAAPLIQAADRAGGVLPRGTLEVWPWLAAAALLALVAEWFVFLRGR